MGILKDMFKDKGEKAPSSEGAKGGAGGAGGMGRPSLDPNEAPPDADQEANEVVSGGGVVGPDDGNPSEAAKS